MLQAKYERKPITYTIFYLAATREFDHTYDADHCCDVCAKGADLKIYGVDLACVPIFQFFLIHFARDHKGFEITDYMRFLLAVKSNISA